MCKLSCSIINECLYYVVFLLFAIYSSFMPATQLLSAQVLGVQDLRRQLKDSPIEITTVFDNLSAITVICVFWNHKERYCCYVYLQYVTNYACACSLKSINSIVYVGNKIYSYCNKNTKYEVSQFMYSTSMHAGHGLKME